MILFIQVILCLLVPAVTLSAGLKILKNKKTGVKKGLVYKSRTTKKSDAAWSMGNAIMGRTLVAAGFNVGIISAVFLALLVLKTDVSGWKALMWLVFFQIVSLLIPPLTTEYVLNKTFNDNGELIENFPRKKRRK